MPVNELHLRFRKALLNLSSHERQVLSSLPLCPKPMDDDLSSYTEP